MKAYFVHDAKKQKDLMIIPEKDRVFAVNHHIMADFIAVAPNFSQWTGESLNGLPPDTFGSVLATREDDGDVCIIDLSLWQQRMGFYLG